MFALKLLIYRNYDYTLSFNGIFIFLGWYQIITRYWLLPKFGYWNRYQDLKNGIGTSVVESVIISVVSSSATLQGVRPWRGGGVQTVVGLPWTFSGAAFSKSCDQGGQGHKRGVASHVHHNVGRYDERHE